jgi:UDP-N-acetylmuramyl pentapeptide phosphotransferase/UDP-N-acetylglucosamine-1-phosphate transferase
MLTNKNKRNLFFAILFLIGLFTAKSHPYILLVSLTFLFYNLIKVIQDYNKTRIEAKEIREFLKTKWERTKARKTDF